MTVTLDAFDISKTYRGKRVLSDFSLSLKRGKIHGLLGPNGSGKTTSLHIITGLLDPTSGDVVVCGKPISAKASRNEVGFAPDDLPLPGALTGREYLEFHDAMRKRKDGEHARVLVRALGLDNDLNRQLTEYSHGMRRKIQIVAATMHMPRALILDEPYRGLDPESSAVLRDLIVSFASGGRSVLIATHDMLRAQRDCDEVTILNDGITVALGSPSELIDRQSGSHSLEDVFLRFTGREQDNDARRESIETLFGSTKHA